MRIIRSGDRGEAVRDIQHRLTELGHRVDPAELEGQFGRSTEEAVRAFQRARRLPADGIVGADTWNQLVEAGYRLGDRTLYLRSPAFRGDDVRALQRMLNALGFDAGKEDGILGRRSADAVMEFQRNLGDTVDGIVGLDTVRALERMRPTLGGPGLAVVREGEAVRSMGASLDSATLAVDATSPELDQVSFDQARGADLALSLALDLGEILASRGATPVLLRRANESPSASDRADTANAVEALVCVSLHPTDEHRGAACAYWGTATTHSPAGRRLAELIQAELTRLGLPDAGMRPLAVALLRETRMPAVRVEIGVATTIGEDRGIEHEAVRRRVADAVADGIARFLSGSAA
ncbi:MAG TPA: peptidoglycan-binding protein [Actinomycetota bacterium]|nr:peptidoglycan-binding protein [Actinomycetota bacterium]